MSDSKFLGNPKGKRLIQFQTGDETWELAETSVQGDYVNLKLYAIGYVWGKANYWLGFNKALGRFARIDSIALLEAIRPELYRLVLGYITERHKAT